MRNLASISYAIDNVFQRRSSPQIATAAGRVDAGYEASLIVGVAA